MFSLKKIARKELIVLCETYPYIILYQMILTWKRDKKNCEKKIPWQNIGFKDEENGNQSTILSHYAL